MMKPGFAACILLVSVTLAPAQGIQGNVKISGSASVVTTGHAVSLAWDSSPGAASYNVYRGTSNGGPYTKLATGVTSPAYTDIQVTHKQTLYYVTTAVSGTYESSYGNQVTATIP